MISSAVCERTRCFTPPDKISSNNLYNDWSGTNVLLGSTITYFCPSGEYFESDRSQSSVAVLCDASTAEYLAPDPWPVCVSNIECEDPPEAPSDSGTKEYVTGVEGQKTYLTTIEYTCGAGRIFADGRTVISLVCLWDKTWSEELTACNITHCAVPPYLPSSRYLEDRAGAASMTAVGSLRDYDCIGFSRMEHDYDERTYSLRCFENGTYEAPEWPFCLLDVNCPADELPDIPEDGTLFVNGFLLGDLGVTVETGFGTELGYRCGPERMFRNASVAEGDEGTLYLERMITCQWDKTWTPSNTLEACAWLRCLRPPTPPDEANLVLHEWDGEPVEFEDEVEFRCKPEHYFRQNRSQISLFLKCNEDGSFLLPKDIHGNSYWPECVESNVQHLNFLYLIRFLQARILCLAVVCPQPPQPLRETASRTFFPAPASFYQIDSNRKKRADDLPQYMVEYGATIQYDCGVAMEFYGRGAAFPPESPEYDEWSSKPVQFYKHQNITCMWNGQWYPSPLFDECQCKFELHSNPVMTNHLGEAKNSL